MVNFYLRAYEMACTPNRRHPTAFGGAFNELAIDPTHSGYNPTQFGYVCATVPADLCTIVHLKIKTMAQQQTDTAQAVKTTTKIWFITGASGGCGRVWTEAALQRGDKVVATARRLESIADLKEKYGASVLTLAVDVTNAEQVTAAVNDAHAHFGRLDVVLNNAGYSLVSTIEEARADDIRQLYETNVLGPVAVIQAALPLLRQQGHGHLVGVSSSLGHVTHPVIGYYCSSKWAFEAIYESLATEVKPFGIDVTIIEPGAYATEFG